MSGRRFSWHQLVRGLLMICGVALAANAIWLAAVANLTLGTLLVTVVALCLVAWAIWYPTFSEQRWLMVVTALILLAVLGLASFLAGFGAADDVRYDERAVIVLGAAVHGSELSRTLTGRLDAAVAYHQRNPAALIVVSGGQGPQEDLPEAVAMQRYLLGRGVAADRIVVEDRATSTEENFAFAKAALAVRLRPDEKVAFITDEFHVYRAGLIAERAGLNSTHLASRTPWYFWPANYLREDLMVVSAWISG